jgi:hypothetical protein
MAYRTSPTGSTCQHIPQDWKSAPKIALPPLDDDNATTILSIHSSTSFHFTNRRREANTRRSGPYKSREELGRSRDHDTPHVAPENASQDQDASDSPDSPDPPARLSSAETGLEFSQTYPQKRPRTGSLAISDGQNFVSVRHDDELTILSNDNRAYLFGQQITRQLSVCERCKKLKKMCDRAQPQCGRCRGRNIECLYDKKPVRKRRNAR